MLDVVLFVSNQTQRHFLKELKSTRFLCFAGDLLPRHMEIFSNNSFFKGLTIPTPDMLVSTMGKSFQGICRFAAIEAAIFRPRATVSRIGLIESCTCHRCCGGPPPPTTTITPLPPPQLGPPPHNWDPPPPPPPYHHHHYHHPAWHENVMDGWALGLYADLFLRVLVFTVEKLKHPSQCVCFLGKYILRWLKPETENSLVSERLRVSWSGWMSSRWRWVVMLCHQFFPNKRAFPGITDANCVYTSTGAPLWGKRSDSRERKKKKLIEKKKITPLCSYLKGKMFWVGYFPLGKVNW